MFGAVVRRRATTILRYLDAQKRPYRQTDVCGTHARELRVGIRVIVLADAPDKPGR
jgi:hypothetical protein